MNTDFLSQELFNQKVDEWVNILKINLSLPLNFESPALIVVDMQNDFLNPDGLLKVWGGPAIIPNVSRLIDSFRSTNYPVIFTQVVYGDPETDGGAMARWWNLNRQSMLVREGTEHAALHKSMNVNSKDKIIVKRRYSGFFKTDLDLILRNWGVKDVVIAGVCSNICCEATAHDALAYDFNVFFLLDGTGGTDEETHLATLRGISLHYGRVIVTNQVIKSLKK